MNNLTLTILGILIIFITTSLGATLVFFFKKDLSIKTKQIFLGFAGGIMLSASIFSLIIPSLNDTSNAYLESKYKWIIVVISIILGALFLYALDKIIPHIHKNVIDEEEGIKNNHFSRGSKLFLAVTLHNLPEGLSVGLSFGVAMSQNENSFFISAFLLALGIAIQNFPEGAAVSLPLLEEGYSKKKAFLFGVFSGVVEPLCAILGLFLASQIKDILPWALSFAAESMLYIIIEDLIPEARINSESHFGTWSFIFGFLLMMVLDISFS